MKHTLLKVAIIALLMSTTFTGCQQDDSLSKQVNHSNFENKKFGRKISFEEFKSDVNAYVELQKLQQKSILKSQIKENGYVYDTDEIVLMEYKDEFRSYKTYTFPIYPDEKTDYIHNLVIFERQTGETSTQFFTYYLDETDKNKIVNGDKVDDLMGKTLVNDIFKNGIDNDPRYYYIYTLADGRCVAYSGSAPDNPSNSNSYVSKVIRGRIEYFDIVPCPEGNTDYTLVQPGITPSGGGGGGGSSVNPGSGNPPVVSIPIAYDPDRPENPVTGYPGGYGGSTHNPVATFPIINLPIQIFKNNLTQSQKEWLNNNIGFKLLIDNLVKKGIDQSYVALKIVNFATIYPNHESLVNNLIELAINNPGNVDSILNYLEQNNYSDNVLNYTEEILTYALDHDMTVSYMPNTETVNFNTIDEVIAYLDQEEISYIGTDYDTSIQNQTLSIAKFDMGIYTINLKVKQNLNPWSLEEINASLSGLTMGQEFTLQDDDYYPSEETEWNATIEIYGTSKITIGIPDILDALTIEKLRHFRIKVKKSDGHVYFTEWVED